MKKQKKDSKKTSEIDWEWWREQVQKGLVDTRVYNMTRMRHAQRQRNQQAIEHLQKAIDCLKNV